MSFIVAKTESKFYIYVIMVGDFGATLPAKLKKYSIQYVSGTPVVAAQPVK